ncbi:MAG: aldo/keto reductase, partial [Planctomycetes bacterium]|nr:aldo/keto reductase [Planctomycetota bacterium]
RQVRINHNGTSMDNLKGTTKEPGDVDEVAKHIKKMHADGKGIIAMKLIGNGNFTDLNTRRASIDFVMAMDSVDAAVIGFKSTDEIDEAISNVNAALTQRKKPI